MKPAERRAAALSDVVVTLVILGLGLGFATSAAGLMFLNEKISYFVYAKLMASDDAGIRTPGEDTRAEPALQRYQLTDGDLDP